jgi:hypothetical protein
MTSGRQARDAAVKGCKVERESGKADPGPLATS